MQEEKKEAIRSFLPEWYLANRRDADALWTKYRQMVSERVKCLFSKDIPYDDSGRLHFGSIIVDVEERSPARCVNANYEVNTGSIITQLHLEERHFGGVHALRADLGYTAWAMQRRPEFFVGRFVLGITYSALSNISHRLGLEKMQVTHCEQEDLEDIRASHRVFCRLNKKERPFKVEAVGLPAEVFIERFEPLVPGVDSVPCRP